MWDTITDNNVYLVLNSAGNKEMIHMTWPIFHVSPSCLYLPTLVLDLPSFNMIINTNQDSGDNDTYLSAGVVLLQERQVIMLPWNMKVSRHDLQ